MPGLLVIENEVTMAQLCLDTSAIVENKVYAIHVFADGSSNITDKFKDNSGVCITEAQFVKAFYGGSKGLSVFQCLDDADTYNVYDLAKSGGLYGQYNHQGGTGWDSDASGVDFTDEVMNLWKSETCTNWSTCSEMAIRRELIAAHNFKDLANCNVCCSLNYCDLINALNSAHSNGAGNDNQTAMVPHPRNDGSDGHRIALSILLKQSFPTTTDVEVIIHYNIVPTGWGLASTWA
jgi:hypothetical protein